MPDSTAERLERCRAGAEAIIEGIERDRSSSISAIGATAVHISALARCCQDLLQLCREQAHELDGLRKRVEQLERSRPPTDYP